MPHRAVQRHQYLSNLFEPFGSGLSNAACWGSGSKLFYWSLLMCHVQQSETSFVSQGKITVFVVICGSFIITVNAVVSFLVEMSLILNNSVNDPFLFAVYCSTFCSAA